MKIMIEKEKQFIQSLIDSQYTISSLNCDSQEENMFTCVINSKSFNCNITYLKDFNVYLLTTTRIQNNKEITFESEFWFEDYSNEALKKNFNSIINDFITKDMEALLDNKYACQIIYN